MINQTQFRRLTLPALAGILAVSAPMACAAEVKKTIKMDVATEPIPQFRDAGVHDPSVIKVGDTFYVFGSHLAAAKTKDFLQWDMVAAGVNARNPLFDNVLQELKPAFDWAQKQTLWAPDVVQLKDGRFAMVYNSTIGDAPRSALGIAVADAIEGPYKDQGILLKSGMWGEPGEGGAIYDARIHPNVVDPNVFTDRAGQLWMVYGSYSGGIFILKMDGTTGKLLPGQGYGKHLMGGNHSRIEGAYVLYHPQTEFYYLFSSFGGLASDGGYNLRVARCKNPDGPYLDAAGNDMANVKSDPEKPLFDDVSIAPFGVKLMGNFLFERKVGDAGEGIGTGYVSPGHNSAYYDAATSKMLLIFHTRFPYQGEGFQIRVHQMFLNSEGWPVVAPLRYAGETLAPIQEEVAGTYKFIDHGHEISVEIVKSRSIRLERGGKIEGALSGSWRRTGDNGISIRVGDATYDGVLARLWEPDSQRYTLTFSALSSEGVAIWGSKMPQKTDAQLIADVKRALVYGNASPIIANLTLPTEGAQGSRIGWSSSDARVISDKGVVTRPRAGTGDATATLTATITLGAATATKPFVFTIKQNSAGGLVAHYAFDGGLRDGTGRAGAGVITGNSLDNTGGAINFAPGIYGEAAVFDGKSGVRLPDGVLAGANYAVALWVKPAQLTTLTPVFFGARDRDNWLSLLPQGHDGAGNNAMVWARNGSWYDAATKVKIPLDKWTHLALSVQNGDLTVYVNGDERFKGANFPDIFNTTTGTFGVGVNPWDAPFQGMIDELRVYESALSSEEIRALALAPR